MRDRHLFECRAQGSRVPSEITAWLERDIRMFWTMTALWASVYSPSLRILQINDYSGTIIEFITCKIGNNRINFLDTTIIVENNIIKFDLYYKPTFFEEIFNYHSQHPLSHKKGPIFEMVNKVILISYPDFHKRNFDVIIKILLDNDYPLKFIFDTVRLRIKTLRNII